ncbi:MAG: tetratricopeptide repeat protein [Thermoanaerobaculia bacterium]
MGTRVGPGVLLIAASLLPAALQAQDWRGKARVDGWVKDAGGQPVAEARVQLSREGRSGGGPSAKTNKKGYWSVMGLIGGTWNVDISAPGYETRKLAVSLSEAARIPPIDVKLEKAALAAPAEGVTGGGGAGPEIIEAIQEGNRLIGEKKYADARALYEKALAAVPENPAILKGIAQTYAGEGNKEKAVETLRKVTEADPADSESRILLASLLLEGGKLEEGKAMLEALPEGAVKDAGVYANVGILFMNKAKPADAAAYLTKAIVLAPADADLYYYRGLAYMQEQKNAEAKADLRKYLELKPDGPEAKEVREILQALK